MHSDIIERGINDSNSNVITKSGALFHTSVLYTSTHDIHSNATEPITNDANASVATTHSALPW